MGAAEQAEVCQLVLQLLSLRSGISVDSLLGPSSARTVSELRSVAMFLLPTELGLSAADTARVFGRSRATVLDLSRLVASRLRRAGD